VNRTLLLLLALAGTAIAAPPAWDSSGNTQLTGTYNFRQVQYTSDGSGRITQQIAYFGDISFDGVGGYTLSGSNSQLNTGPAVSIQPTGTYSVSASGYGFLSDPLVAGASVYFLVSNHILIGGATENGGLNGAFNNDLFVAAPATPTFTNASFSGAYTLAGFLPGLDVTYQLNPDGAGHLGTVNKSGYDGTGTFDGSTSNVSYAFTNGVALINYNAAFSANGNIVTYFAESLCMSPDSNFVFGGSPTGYDMFVGVRNATGGPGTLLSLGLYNEIGLDEDESIATWYGAFNSVATPLATGLNVIGHERLLYAGSPAENFTYATSFPDTSCTGAANVSQSDSSATMQYTVGAGGIRIGFGIGPFLGIEVALPAPTINIYLDPTIFVFPNGIVDAASSAPFTAGISPGEFITIYNGVNLATGSNCWTAGPPFPTMLDNVRVFIDNILAPIYCAGSQITVIVPYEVSSSPIATIQVVTGSGSSNIVTAYVRQTTPGVFTVPAGGIGLAAAQHGDYSLVTNANPAQPGEEIVVYLSGLGSVLPVKGVAAVDGAATPPAGDPIAANVGVQVAGISSTSIPYAGLTPGTAGRYQINFQVPATAPTGIDTLSISAPGSYTSEAFLPVGTAPLLLPPAVPVPARFPPAPASIEYHRPREPFRRETQLPYASSAKSDTYETRPRSFAPFGRRRSHFCRSPRVGFEREQPDQRHLLLPRGAVRVRFRR